jgi:hypothetical protein
MGDTGRDEPDLADQVGNHDLGEAGLENDPDVGPQVGGRGSVITLTTVIALLIATGLTVLGVGTADTAVANFDASSWLWSSTRGEMDRVNGITARVDTRTKIQDAQNHEIQVTQTDKYLILRDLNTGQISALDLATLQISAVMPTTPGLGVSVALAGEMAFVIDSVQGQIRQLDPRSLAPIGDSITLPNGIVAGGFDGKGSLWVAVPSEGTIVAITPGTNGASPKVLRTLTVADPGHDLVLSTLDDGVAVLDNTQPALTVVRGDRSEVTALPIQAPGAMPARTTGAVVAITVAESHQVVLVNGTKVTSHTIPGKGPHLPAVVFAGHIYVPDPTAGIVYELDGGGRTLTQISINPAGGVIELEVRENHLFINAPNGSTARVVNDKHIVKDVDKYAEGVLGADPPPPPPVQEQKPAITVPGKPQNLTASAGDKTVTITWRRAASNGAEITKYVIEGAGQSHTVGASQRSFTVEGLVNAQTYTFTVHAVNRIGAGAKAKTPPITPTADVPDAPASVTATALPDGAVEVTWPAANGQGRRILSYTVTSISGGGEAPVGSVTGTTMTIATGSLTYGTQYAFAVVAINDRNAGSPPSPVSNTVVPFTAPGPPQNLQAATDPDQTGAIQVAWRAAEDNGRPITEYVVDGGNGPQQVSGTSATLTGFQNDEVVQVTVHAVNEAGAGADATATARTMDVPTLTWTSDGAGYNEISVTFTPDNRGGNATCIVQVSGAGSAQAACDTQPVTLTVGGLWPNNTYTYTASVTNAAGTASDTDRTKPTNQLRFTVICPDNSSGYCNSGIWAYRTPSQQGTAANPALPVGSTAVPECYTTGNRFVNATPWGGKNSDQWLRFQHGGTAYFPWAWASLDGGDNLGRIPRC